MKTEEVRAMAERALGSTDLRGYKADFHGCRQSPLVPEEWDVVFDLVAPTGERMSGGIVVIVDGKTGTARVSDDL